MRIQFIHAPVLSSNTFTEQNPSAPLGIMYLASYLKKNCGHNIHIKITDGILLGRDRTLREVICFRPDIAAISFLTINAGGAYQLINQIKQKLPETLIVAGGVHATALPMDVFRHSKTDIVVLGEGENTFCDIINAVIEKTDLENIPGVILSEHSERASEVRPVVIPDLDALPVPDYSLVEDTHKYRGLYFQKKRPEIMILSSRGCKFKCSYCVDGKKRNFRTRSVENVVDELRILKHAHGVKEFFDQGSSFNHDMQWASRFCKQLIDKKLDLSWKTLTRADKITQELAVDMKKAGCWIVFLGVESGNQSTLDSIHKGITLQQVQRACEIFKKAGIKVMAMFMFFNFWDNNGRLEYEDLTDCMSSFAFAKGLLRNRMCDFISWSPTIPYPGTDLYETAKKYNLIQNSDSQDWEKWNHIYNEVVQLPGITEHDYAKVKSLGARLQIKCTLKNFKYINWNLSSAFWGRAVKGFSKKGF